MHTSHPTLTNNNTSPIIPKRISVISTANNFEYENNSKGKLNVLPGLIEVSQESKSID